MSRERIDIIVDEKELIKNDEKKDRLKKTLECKKTDRSPAIIDHNFWDPITKRGSTYEEFIKSAEDNMKGQILNYKWDVENILDDNPINTSVMEIEPEFGALRGNEFPLEIIWPKNQPGKVKHMLKDVADIDKLRVPDPSDGLNTRKINWYKEMCEVADDLDVRVNGQRIEIKPTLSNFGGPIPSAFALAGSNLLLWMMSDPEKVHRLMDIVTESHIQVISYFDSLTGREPHHFQPMGADIAEMLSPDTFKEFVVPYYNKVWETYSGYRSLHMCGKIDHLLQSLRDDLCIDYLNGFGFCDDIDLLEKEFGSRVALKGGPSPMLMQNGPIEEIKSKREEYLSKLGCHNGFILSVGGDSVPGTPYEHYRMLTRGR